MVKSDSKTLMIGKRLYDSSKCQSEKIQDVEKRARSVMRQLARLYITFKNDSPSAVDAADMFKKQNLKHLRTAIEELSESGGKIKSGLKVNKQLMLVNFLQFLDL